MGANVNQGLYGILVITPDGKVYESLGLNTAKESDDSYTKCEGSPGS